MFVMCFTFNMSFFLADNHGDFNQPKTPAQVLNVDLQNSCKHVRAYIFKLCCKNENMKNKIWNSKCIFNMEAWLKNMFLSVNLHVSSCLTVQEWNCAQYLHDFVTQNKIWKTKIQKHESAMEFYLREMLQTQVPVSKFDYLI